MHGFRTFLRWLIVAGIFVGGLTFVITNYSWVFAKKVKGRIINVERVTDPSAILSARVTQEQLHSYAILIQDEGGKLYTASSEDRKWQVAKKGYCVEALLYVYPPWDLGKAHTYFNARLDDLSLCPGETAPPAADPSTAPPPSAAPLPTPEHPTPDSVPTPQHSTSPPVPDSH